MKTTACMTRADVKKIMEVAEAEATKHKWPVAITVFDDAGNLQALAVLDGATAGNVGISKNKGRSAALSRRSTKMWQERIEAGQMHMLSLGYATVQGGLPIMVLGECVGGVGVSGAAAAEDEQVAQAGIDALGS